MVPIFYFALFQCRKWGWKNGDRSILVIYHILKRLVTGRFSTEKWFKSCREYRDHYLEYSGSIPFVWSQSINSRMASFSWIGPVETHNNRIIITISGGGYPFKNFQTWLKLNFYSRQCVQWIWVSVCVPWKQRELSNSRQDNPD